MTQLVSGFQLTPTLRLLRPLRSGGMGSVWVAENTALDSHVAVKFLTIASQDELTLSRFRREAATASQIKSPHVVQIFDHGLLPDNTPYIVMELLEGEDLTHRLRGGGPLPLRAAAEMLTQVGKALQKAHDKGIIHRDIKPDNIFLCDTDGDELFCKLLDFGIAKFTRPKANLPSTATGTLIGTPHYMSPEQAVGSKDIDHRTDLWSLGMVAFEALTCRRAFDGDNLGALLLAIHTATPPVPSSANPALPKEIDRWFSTACARRAAERFSSAREMTDAFWAAIGEPQSRAGRERSGELSARLARNIQEHHEKIAAAPTVPHQPPAPALPPTAVQPPAARPPDLPSLRPPPPPQSAPQQAPPPAPITLDRRPIPRRVAPPLRIRTPEDRSPLGILLLVVCGAIALLAAFNLYLRGKDVIALLTSDTTSPPATAEPPPTPSASASVSASASARKPPRPPPKTKGH